MKTFQRVVCSSEALSLCYSTAVFYNIYEMSNTFFICQHFTSVAQRRFCLVSSEQTNEEHVCTAYWLPGRETGASYVLRRNTDLL